jgi:hypothetical protein
LAESVRQRGPCRSWLEQLRRFRHPHNNHRFWHHWGRSDSFHYRNRYSAISLAEAKKSGCPDG